MELTLIAGGTLGIVISLLCCFACYEMSIAYWLPQRAGCWWRSFVTSPKLAFFAPAFRWFMPLCGIIALVQLAAAVQVLRAGLAAG